MKIVFFSNIPAPYCVSYLNELGKLADVTAVFEKSSFNHRDKSWKKIDDKNFKLVILSGLNIGNIHVIALSAIKYIKENSNAKIIFANPLTLNGILCILYCKRLKIPYALQSEGGIPKNGRGIKEYLKKYILRGASLYLSGMKPERDYFLAYGADIEKIVQYPFSSLYKNDLIRELPSDAQKLFLKKELGISNKYVVLYVGRIIISKGIDILIKAASGLTEEVGIYLIGGKETDEYSLLAKKCGVNNLHYIEHIPLELLKKYYLAADVFVLPTRKDTWGLVINEAMSFALPIITTENCVAGVELIDNGVNGYLIKNEDVDTLHDKIQYLLNNPELRNIMASNNIERISSYTFENMAKRIYVAIAE